MARGVFRSVAEAEKTTVGEVIARYEAEILIGKKSIAPDRARLKTLREEFGVMMLASLTSAHVARFRDRRLQPGELERILASTESKELGAIVLLAVETAMRRSEIAGLVRSNIDLKKRILVLPDTKNGERRVVPLSTKAVELLAGLPPRIGRRVFGMAPDSISQAFERACARAGIEDLRYHDLRHEAASRLFERG